MTKNNKIKFKTNNNSKKTIYIFNPTLNSKHFWIPTQNPFNYQMDKTRKEKEPIYILY